MKATLVPQPLSGESYLESLRDGRRVFFQGEEVRDVTQHPAFRNAARSVARLYDALHDPKTQALLLKEDHTGLRTHKFFAPAFSPKDLEESAQAIEFWQRMSFGWMGRTPDYKAAFMATLGADPEYYAPFAQTARRWYQACASQVLFINHVLVDPPVDRNRPPVEARDVLIHVEKETDGGIVVSGAKQVATSAPLTHATFVGLNSGTTARLQEGRDEDLALIFLVRMDNPRQYVVCRSSYEHKAESPFDAPLSSRFDENDALLILDKAFIPWEDVLVYRDIPKAKRFYADSGFFNRFNLQTTVRFAVKLEFLTGLLQTALEANGTQEFRGNRVLLGELVALRHLLRALIAAMVHDPEPSLGGSVVPRLEYAAAARVYTNFAWERIRQIYERLLGGAPILNVSSYRDFHNPELQPLLERYLRGTGLGTLERSKLYKLVWDAMFSEFAGRHGLYELNYAGNHEQKYLDPVEWSERRGLMAAWKDLVQDCLAQYNLEGWGDGGWAWEKGD